MRQRFTTIRADLPVPASRIDTARAEAAQQARLETVVLRTKPAPCVRSSSGSRPSKGVRRQANAQDPASYERRSSPHRRAAAGEAAGRSTLRARQTREQIPHQLPRRAREFVSCPLELG
ncbi:hypothetical protein ACPCAJ_32770 [Streptomyces griseoincarnatus]